MTLRDVVVDGVRLACAVGPEAGPPLVLVHGGSSHWRSWEPLLPALTRAWQVWAVDLPGHGGSERTPGRYGVLPMGRTLAALLRVTGGRAVLFGHALGGLIALAAGEAVPDLLGGLILGDAPLRVDRLRRSAESQRAMSRRWQDFCSGGEPTAESSRTGELPPWLPLATEPSALADPGAPGILVEHFDAFFSGYDPERMLKALPCPVLLLQGDPELGGLLPDADVEAARGWRPDLECVRLAGLGSELHQGNPDLVLEALLPFLERLRQR